MQQQFANGTTALHLALETLGIKIGDEIIRPYIYLHCFSQFNHLYRSNTCFC